MNKRAIKPLANVRHATSVDRVAMGKVEYMTHRELTADANLHGDELGDHHVVQGIIQENRAGNVHLSGRRSPIILWPNLLPLSQAGGHVQIV